ncbi:MAG TPA: hypothetical protein VFY13_07355 [Luteolibacter sp.]|nr:hypothetical protein [Luteolibacter sp.]
MHEPVRILSDLHLGHKVSRIGRVQSLRPLIAGAGTMIFNGDTWQELAEPWRVRSAEMLEELKALCVQEGAEAVFLSGNHDPGWPGRGWVELAQGRIVVTHGDALLFASSPWKREIMLAPQRIAELWDQHPAAATQVEERLRIAREIARELHATEFPQGRHLLQRAWDAVVPPRRALHMLEAWGSQAQRGAEFCERYFPRAEVMVIGHFHWPGSWRVGRRRVINTGTFVSPNRARWVEWNRGWLRHGKVDERHGACRLGKVLEAWSLG